MPRAVDEWRGKTDDTPAPTRVRLRVRPLSGAEAGRGAHLPDARVAELRSEILRLVSSGYSQRIICEALNATRSRVSRWLVREVMASGSSLRLVNTQGRSLAEMMWDRVEKRGPDECRQWLGAIKSHGYGAFNYKGKGFNAHRLMYEAVTGPIPDGMVIDHTCCNRSCVNPRHLQVVTQSENVRLSWARGMRGK